MELALFLSANSYYANTIVSLFIKKIQLGKYKTCPGTDRHEQQTKHFTETILFKILKINDRSKFLNPISNINKHTIKAIHTHDLESCPFQNRI